jgi:hypothetical protein
MTRRTGDGLSQMAFRRAANGDFFGQIFCCEQIFCRENVR